MNTDRCLLTLITVHLYNTGRQHVSCIFAFNPYFWLTNLCHDQDKMCEILFSCFQEEVTNLSNTDFGCEYTCICVCTWVCICGCLYICPRPCCLLYFHNRFLNKPKHGSATKLDTEQDIVAAFTSRERIIKRKIRKHIQNPHLLGEGVSTLGNPTRA